MHPVTYFSKKILLAKQNYNIYKKELLVIVEALKYWKIYLQGAHYPITIYINYINLYTFITMKILDNCKLA